MSLPYERGGMLAPFHDKPHLWIVMNDGCSAGQCLVIMISTIYASRPHDPACVLDVGDHDFLDHPSYAVYRLAETPTVARVQALLARGYYKPKEDFPAATFARIAKGIFASDETRRRIVTYAETVGLD